MYYCEICGKELSNEDSRKWKSNKKLPAYCHECETLSKRTKAEKFCKRMYELGKVKTYPTENDIKEVMKFL